MNTIIIVGVLVIIAVGLWIKNNNKVSSTPSVEAVTTPIEVVTTPVTEADSTGGSPDGSDTAI